MVGDLAHPLVSHALANEDMILTMTYPLSARSTATTTTAMPPAADTTTTVAPVPLLTDIEIEVWWSSLTALGHLLTDCVPAKTIVDSSMGLRVLVRALLPLTRSLAAASVSGSGGGGGGGGSSSSITPLVGSTSTTSSTTTSSSTNTSTNMAHPYINPPSETVPSRPTIISTLLLGTATTTTTQQLLLQ